MTSKIKVAIAFLCIAFLATGCATIIGGGGTQDLNFASNPAGAEIYMGKLSKGKVVGLVNTGQVTPYTLTVSRKNAVVILKKEGYQDTNIILKKTVNGWFFGNIIIGGLLGSSIDSSTGAINRYDSDNLFLEMVKVGEEAPETVEDQSAQ